MALANASRGDESLLKREIILSIVVQVECDLVIQCDVLVGGGVDDLGIGVWNGGEDADSGCARGECVRVQALLRRFRKSDVGSS